eukprot:TRINITY_DN43219_c0_g1_i1.p1 TRINITY_DN43219_c0_g1~~TRINITY_DN43219_c0_g1_i1.p1  ORF type:complete len:207 (+),score=43.13 TRINITY_DN43219_c0_g1_i1:82-702(+)
MSLMNVFAAFCCCPSSQEPTIEAVVQESAIKGGALPEDDAKETLRVVLNKDMGPLGIELDTNDPAICMIVRIHPEGQVASRNEGCPEGEDLRVYDRIVEVNGVSGDASALVEVMRNSGTCMHVTIERPVMEVIEVKQAKKKLQFDLMINEHGAGLKIKQLSFDGAGDCHLSANNRVVEVNGESISSNNLMDLIKLDECTIRVCKWQ